MTNPSSGDAPDRNTFSRFRAGADLGHSPWLQVDQTMIDRFGEVTHDPDPMHIDPQWAQRDGPYPHTIAFGFLTMSLLTYLLRSALSVHAERGHRSEGYYMNYGFDRLRLVSPVPVDSRIRGVFRVIDTRLDDKARIIVKFDARIEIEGQPRPALVAEWLSVWVPPAADSR